MRTIHTERPTGAERPIQAERGRPERPTVRVRDERVARVGLGSAAVLSAVVGLLTAAIGFLAGVALYHLGAAAGAVTRLEDLARTFTGDSAYVVDGEALVLVWAALAVMWAVALTVVGVALAVIVNLGCALTGGLRLRLVTHPRRRPGRAPAVASDPTAPDASADEGEHPPLAA